MKLIEDLGVINGRRRGIYECKQCNIHTERRTSHVKSSKTNLCQACIMSNRFKTHGKTNTRLFNIWQGVKARCYNKNTPNYKYYGSKGITVCQEWIESFESFEKWALENGYEETLVLDKDIKSDELGLEFKIYSPETCIWITTLENTAKSNEEKIREVYQYDLDMNFIAKYQSQSEAARQTGFSQGNIGSALRQDFKQSNGYLWKYN